MFGFLIAVAAGALTPMLEGPVARPVARKLSELIEVQDTEIRVIAFMIAMVLAAVLCAIFSTGSALGVMIGGVLGYFGARLARWFYKIIENRPG